MAQKKSFKNNPALAFISIDPDTIDTTSTNDAIDTINTKDTVNTRGINDIVDTFDTIDTNYTNNSIDTNGITKNITIRFNVLNYDYLKLVSKINGKSINKYINELVEFDQDRKKTEIEAFEKMIKNLGPF